MRLVRPRAEHPSPSCTTSGISVAQRALLTDPRGRRNAPEVGYGFERQIEVATRRRNAVDHRGTLARGVCRSSSRRPAGPVVRRQTEHGAMRRREPVYGGQLQSEQWLSACRGRERYDLQRRERMYAKRYLSERNVRRE